MNKEEIVIAIQNAKARLGLATTDDEYYTLSSDLDRLIQMLDEFDTNN